MAFGYEPSSEEISYLYGGDDFISIATGHKQRLSQAPAVASVITAKEIEAMGAQNLTEVLETVPGLHISLTASNYNPVIVMRGIRSDLNQQTLILINGFPVKNSSLGDRGDVLKSQPLSSISRIEVIRGPGSAVYGADALAGVINIITKSAADINGVEVGASQASFDTQKAWFLYGGQAGGWDVAFGLDAMKTDGHHGKIAADQQSLFDASQGTSASLAPGGVNLQRKGVDFFLDIEKDKWRLRAGYHGVFDDGIGAGLVGALDPQGKGDAQRYTADVTYHDADFTENWDATVALSFYDLALKGGTYRVYPAGAFGSFPDGVIGSPDLYERHYGLDVTSFYTGFDSHTVRLGAGYQYLDLYRVESSGNFLFNAGGVPVDLGSVQETPDDQLFNRESLRKNAHFFIQDEWRFAQDFTLFTGLRYDHFSDFGGTFNPRISLVWEAGALTSKFLYGRAFRAPSFAEQNNKSNPVNIGNTNLDPEIANTYEVVFDYGYSPDLRGALNLFYYEIEDLIRFTPVAQNSGVQVGRGFELEFEWQANALTSLTGSFALQRAKDKSVNSAVANVPRQQLYLRLDRQLTAHWAMNSRVNWVMGRERDKADKRKSIDDYATLDLTLQAKNLLPGLKLSLSAFNLTGENAREPSPYNRTTNSVAIPGDFPLAGRSVLFQISQSW